MESLTRKLLLLEYSFFFNASIYSKNDVIEENNLKELLDKKSLVLFPKIYNKNIHSFYYINKAICNHITEQNIYPIEKKILEIFFWYYFCNSSIISDFETSEKIKEVYQSQLLYYYFENSGDANRLRFPLKKPSNQESYEYYLNLRRYLLIYFEELLSTDNLLELIKNNLNINIEYLFEWLIFIRKDSYYLLEKSGFKSIDKNLKITDNCVIQFYLPPEFRSNQEYKFYNYTLCRKDDYQTFYSNSFCEELWKVYSYL